MQFLSLFDIVENMRSIVANSVSWHNDVCSWRLNFTIGPLLEATIVDWELLQDMLRNVAISPIVPDVFV